MQWTGQEPALNEDSEWGRQAGKFKEEHSIFSGEKEVCPMPCGGGALSEQQRASHGPGHPGPCLDSDFDLGLGVRRAS